MFDLWWWFVRNSTSCVHDVQVATKQLQQWCSLKGGIASFESSAKEAINVEQAFQEAARKALAQEMQHDQYNDFPDQIQLNANTPSQQPREACSCWVCPLHGHCLDTLYIHDGPES